MRRTLRGLAWFAFLASLVATGLHFVPLLRQDLRDASRAVAATDAMRQAREAMDVDARHIVDDLRARMQASRGAGLEAALARQREVVDSLERERMARRAPLLRQAAWITGEGLADDLRRELRIEALEAELSWLATLVAALRFEDERRALLRELLVRERAQYDELRARFDGRCPVGRVRWYELRASPEQVRLCRDYAATRAEVGRLRALTRRAADLPGLPVLELGEDARVRMEARLAELTADLERRRFARHLAGIRAQFPAAAVWLAGVLLVAASSTVLFRVVWYFAVAPWVARRPPVRLLPAGSSTATPVARPSAVSQVVTLQPGEELLVHARFLQSIASGARMRTRWLLDLRYPLTSLAAGLAAMTRIRTDAPADFVVSATGADAFSEIAELVLPEGCAMVLQPRCLVGIVQRRDRPLRITRHWRLRSLHAWLTLQLRFLVFHGPVTLLVAGARGVRVERARDDRAINQSATLGFTADVAYSQVRTPTFFPYLSGRQALFDDRFAGEGGVFAYEESVGYGRGRGPVGRQLEGLADALLRILGI